MSAPSRALVVAAVVCLAACTAAPTGGSAAPSPSSSPSPSPSPTAEAAPPVRVGTELVASGLTLPVGIVWPPGEPDRTLVVDAVGLVSTLGADGSLTTFLDVRDRVVALDPDDADDRGLLGLAFHPAYAENGRAFAFRTRPPDPGSEADHVNVLSELRALPDRSGLDPASEQVLLEVPQHQAVHSGGQLLFDADDALLVFLGDGGERNATAQDPASLLGKVLRLDVDAVPGAPPEVHASGLRHPWRVSIDEESSRVLIAEPAADREQEVNVLAAGANYGWDLEMPDGCLTAQGPTPPACLHGSDGQALTLPVAEYERRLGQIVSGAHVYRGAAMPELTDKLVLSDLGQNTSTGQPIGGRINVADAGGEPPWTVVPAEFAGDAPRGLFWGLDSDAAGELYLLVVAATAPPAGLGSVHRLVPPDR